MEQGLRDLANQTLVESWEVVAPHLTGDPTFSRYASVIAMVDSLQSPVLDVGSGQGLLSHCLKELGCGEIVAFDISNYQAKMVLRKRQADHVLVADIHHLPFRESVFGTAFGCETIEHWKDPAKGMREIERVLNGKLVLSTDSYAWHYLHKLHLEMLSREHQPIDHPVPPGILSSFNLESYQLKSYYFPIAFILAFMIATRANSVPALRRIAMKAFRPAAEAEISFDRKINYYRSLIRKSQVFPAFKYRFNCLSIVMCFDFSK